MSFFKDNPENIHTIHNQYTSKGASAAVSFNTHQRNWTFLSYRFIAK
jgi:methionine synthase I (cobalamin-dependent)